MPIYTYRREDGTTFDIRQKFADDPLQVDPETGQKVTRVIQAAGIVFKGSGFYVNDSKGSKANLSTPTNGNGTENGKTTETAGKADASSDTSSTKSENSSAKTESKSENKSKTEKNSA